MPDYIDGFLLSVPKKHRALYTKLAKKAGKVWMDHGALEYWECAGEDLKVKKVVSFVQAAKSKPGEMVVFSYIRFKSRRHRDAVNAKVMKDPRMLKMMESALDPFDMNRMVYGGFEAIVKLVAKE